MPRTGAREEGGGRRNHHDGGEASSWLTIYIIVMLHASWRGDSDGFLGIKANYTYCMPTWHYC
jgi:hypothetical protein